MGGQPGRRNKFGAHPCFVFPDGQVIKIAETATQEAKDLARQRGGIWFGSKREAERFVALRWMQEHEIIKDLQRQVRFKLEVDGSKVATYVADFTYTDLTTGKECVEDCKGFQTPTFKLKWKMLQALYPKYDFIIS